ncbi:MAG: CRISPR system precrRNA processing endoribonuclease RAMP protein Cas6 [Desulfobulbaceae bacterium]|nr:CRISPR system precrRNA processing endoribonuclease RAMP protein Cas6 [Desulfobulbaceae bacterium]
MDNVNLGNLSFAAFQVTFRVVSDEPVRLPSHTGSALHGAFGWALGRVAYGRKRSCNDCPIRSECRYGSLFEYIFRAPADHPFIAPEYDYLRLTYTNRELLNLREFPPPYIIVPAPGGRYDQNEDIVFILVLVGMAVRFFPYVVCGLEILAAGRLGDNRKARVRLEEIVALDCLEPGAGIPLYNPLSREIVAPGLVFDLDCFTQPSDSFYLRHNDVIRLGLRFLTPLRFRVREKVSSKLDFMVFIRLLLRRILLLSVHSRLADPLPQHELLTVAGTGEVERQRFSFGVVSRGRKSLYGLVGELVATGCFEPLLPYIQLGIWLHIGKAATLGFGHYELFFSEAGSRDGS